MCRYYHCPVYIVFDKFNLLLRKQTDIFNKVILRFLHPDHPEANLVYIGNVVTQYFAHINQKLELNILESIARRLYKVI